jgi:hypothetical protein
LFGGLTSARPLGRRSMRELQRRGWRCPDEQRSLPPYHCCRPAFEVRLHPGIIPRRTDKNVCRFFGAPPRLAACRVFPDNLITYFTCQYADGGGAGVLSPGGVAHGPPSGAGDRPRTTAVDRRSTPSARADRQEPLPMFRCPDSPGFP